eukprot:TRINITY_DN3198_c2_g4_i1.p1 TRINITY_DN3198_c2_g4~~TRINITY_DN3198_c2_g4_i1.p1  ORF type:complete len:193 (-),score=26.24 TRINITY_DN3198_c2_g4_i1:208-765(-)
MEEGYVSVYTVEGIKLFESKAHNNWVISVRISPDMKYFASVSVDGCSKLFSLETYEELQSWSHYGKKVIASNFSSDSAFWTTGDDNGIVRVFDVVNRVLLRKYEVHCGWIYGVIFSQDDSLIYSCSDDRSFAVIRRDTGEVLQKVNVSFSIKAMVLNYDGTRLLCSGYNFPNDVPIEEYIGVPLI